MMFTQPATRHIQALVADNPDIFLSNTPSVSAGSKFGQVLLGALQTEFIGRIGVPSYLYAGHIRVLNRLNSEKGQQIIDFADDRGLFLV